MAFGLRNVAVTYRGLAEMVSVCRPGGEVFVREFSRLAFHGWVTLYEMLLGYALAVVIAIPLAILCAVRSGSATDRFLTGLAFGKLSLPPFMVAILLIYLFAVSLNLLPATGWIPFAEDSCGNLKCVDLSPGPKGAFGQVVAMANIGRLRQSYRDFPHVTGDREVMWKLYVHPDHHGRGIGSRLLAEVEAMVEGDELWLEVVDGNDQAFDFYRARGFEEVERVTDGEWPDDVWLRKRLDEQPGTSAR